MGRDNPGFIGPLYPVVGVAFTSVYRFPESGRAQFYGWFFGPLDWVARRVPLFGDAYNGYHQWCYRNFVASDRETQLWIGATWHTLNSVTTAPYWSPPMSLEAFKSAVMPMLVELEASANAHDTDRHMAVYARESSLTFVFNGEIVRGWDQLRELQRQWWSDGKVKGSYTYLDSPIFEALGDNAGLTTFLIAAKKEAVDGSVVEKTLAYSALWRRLQEGWRITFAHESSDK